MSLSKLQKFAALGDLPNTFQNFSYLEPQLINHEGKQVSLQGNWGEAVFGNNNPITLELACGRGEYTVALASRFPSRNFIAVDIKGNRIWNGANKAHTEGLKNAAFLRTEIALLPHFLGPDEIDEIWITFPDPYLKKCKWKKRLTSSRFLKEYRKFCKAGAYIHLKTDDDTLYQFTLETVADPEQHCTLETDSADIYQGKLPIPELEIKTYYEGMHLEQGKTIKYVRFSLNRTPRA